MLSVLIPVYNFDISGLVYELHRQLGAGGKPFEIILMDDASEDKFRKKNSLLQEMSFVWYLQLERNIGRSRIRNELAKQAQFEYLLFLDCDSGIMDACFIKRYLKYFSGGQVVCGGRVYPALPPATKQYLLHWLYGSLRESIPLPARLKAPFSSFMTHNFLISKSIFNRIYFDEDISGYGHEDTLFGYQLKEQQFSVIHIDNPVLHQRLEPTELFLSKTQTALTNLKKLYEKHAYNEGFIKSIRILHIYSRIRKLGLIKAFAFFGKFTNQFLLYKLKGDKPRLVFFDLYKLFYLAGL